MAFRIEDHSQSESSTPYTLPIDRPMNSSDPSYPNRMEEPLDCDRHVLIVDDDELVRERLASIMNAHGYAPTAVGDAKAALEAAAQRDFDAFFVDIQLPGIDGFELLGRLREVRPHRPVVIITTQGDVDSAVMAMRSGAFDFLAKPVLPETLMLCLDRIFQMKALDEEIQQLRRTAHSPSRIGSLIGASEAMQNIFSMVRRVSNSSSTVLITGESGTGKEVVARAIHEQSARSSRPFVAINCAAIPEGLLESELFGHVKGSFSGAVTNHQGLFLEGNGGTVFLDEIGEMDERLQTKLLRFLQEREVRSIGSSRTEKVDVRVLAATNRDLAGEIREGRFRQDLYYRLNVIPIAIPPLRERPDDIEPLAHFFMERHGGDGRQLEASAVEVLNAQPWPGNARELENVIERSLTLSDEEIITAEDLTLEEKPFDFETESSSDIDELLTSAALAQTSLRDLENKYIDAVLSSVEGNKAQAAKILGVDRTTLYRRKEGA